MYCPKCDETIFASILRHNTSSRPIDIEIIPLYCPLCGTPLIDRKEDEDDE